MEGFAQDSIKKNIISVSRNTPVALVVGVGSFLGSSLADRLLGKEIQVVGVDDFLNGSRKNLEEATKDKRFHLLEVSDNDLDLNLDRLDYIFIAVEKRWKLTPILKLFRDKKARLLFISSIDLYSKENSNNWMQNSESELAKFAQENNLNARILRLSSVYGPRMDFSSSDPMVRLIKKTLEGNNQSAIDDFSTRALYIDDCIDLMIKCIFSGSTALKIFDGALQTPIKIEDVKQVLLDPIWHEQKNFKPQELPPWPTPNLEKTIRILNWQPKADLVSSLKKTLSYFKDREIEIDPEEDKELKKENVMDEIKKEWKMEKQKVLQEFSAKGEPASGWNTEDKEKIIRSKTKWTGKFKFPKAALVTFIITLLLSYSILLPILKLGWGVITFKLEIAQASQNLIKGDFDQALNNVSKAELGLDEAKIILESLESVRKISWFNNQFERIDKFAKLGSLSTSAARSSILGVRFLYEGLKSVTGENTAPAKDFFEKSQVELDGADKQFAQAQALISDKEFSNNLPKILQERIESLKLKLNEYANLSKNAQAASLILPQIIAINGTKSYLILLQNNNELRPSGGFIGSFAKVTFEGGKLKKLDVQDIYAIDGQLKFHVEPPKEIKSDLGQKDWYLRDSNWEADFPTSAKQAEWFFNKESGEQVAGVIALDVSAMENLLEVVGPLNLADYNEKISSQNLFEKAITHAEVSFFPGSQAKKNFLTALSNALLNKLFFVPQQNWPGIVSALGKSLEEKHLSIFFDDPKLFSYLVSRNWTGMLPRPADPKEGEYLDFLAPVEANLGANKANYYLKRSYNLETIIGKEGEIKHRFKINFTNTSPSDTWPAGKYKNRFRIYLPFGAKLVRALWGEKDITKEIESFVDYGRSYFSMLLELSPKEVKGLVLDIEAPQKLTFVNSEAVYKLDVVKQAGLLKDPFEWRLTFPLNYKLITDENKIAPQELTISSDLSTDKSFEIRFKK